MAITGRQSKKLDAIDKKSIEIQVEIASLVIEPDEFTSRSIFRGLMPKLFFMRKRGVGYGKIHELLNKVGLPITMATLKTYYHEHLTEMMQECETYYRKANQTRAELDEGQLSEIDRRATIRTMRAANEAAVSAAAEQRIVKANVSTAYGEPLPGALMAPGVQSAASAPLSRGGIQNDAALMAAKQGKGQASPKPAVSVADATAPKTLASSAPQTARVRMEPTTIKKQPLVAAVAEKATCITIPDPIVAERRPGVPLEVYEQGLLEHPAIPGLMLTLNQRVTPGKLEYRNEAGEECIERGSQAVNRLDWTTPTAATVTRTSGDFVEMDSSVLGKRPDNL